LLVLRCPVYVGLCVEFVAAVARLAELLPNPDQQERVLVYTQACSTIFSLGYGHAGSHRRSGLRPDQDDTGFSRAGFSVPLIGHLVSFWLPEPTEAKLAD